MNEAAKDGGPAFPCTNEQFTLGNPQTGDAWAGLSLRDWFAGQVIVGHFHIDPMVQASYAKTAYRMADAMLTERSKAGHRT
jgi:hypothetical protein